MRDPELDSARQLSDDQLLAFDTEYVTDKRWPTIQRCLQEDFSEGQFRFLDVGGGNGVFADRILAAYPKATGTVLDSARVLLDRNRSDPRKTLVCASAERLAELGERSYEVVFFNWVLHHLVGADYLASLENVRRALTTASGLLTSGGRMSIFDNMYDGQAIDGLPSRLIFHLTSSKLLAPLTRRFGANTSGVGVCFLSKKRWDAVLSSAGLAILRYSDEPPWQIPLHRRVLLHLGPVRFGHFWCSARDAAQTR